MNTETNFKLILANSIISESCLSNPDLIQEVFFVETNPARIEKIEVIKLNGIVSKVRAFEEFKLNSHRIIVKQNENSNIVISDELSGKSICSNTNIGQKISENIDACFIKSLKVKNSDRGEIKIKRNRWDIFRKKSWSDLLMDLKFSNWIITTPRVANELAKLDKFSKVEDDGNLNHFGKIENLSIFTHSEIETGAIYVGKLDSFFAIINKDIKIEEFDSGNFYKKGFKILVDYLVSCKGVDKFTICS